MIEIARLKQLIDQAPSYRLVGRVTRVSGLVVESQGPSTRIGELCSIASHEGVGGYPAEVIGFQENRVLLMPLGTTTGIKLGDVVEASGTLPTVGVSADLLGRVLDGQGQPIDDGPPIKADSFYPIQGAPINPLSRKPIREVFSTGIRAIDGMLTCGKGQRVGIFAGSGVGKSTLLGMIARRSSADINVISLVGERGRELTSFLENDLGPDGLARSVVVISTSDSPPLIRMRAALTATAVAEYFKDQGQNVLLMMDSVTRFAMAQREVGLSAGEPPSSKGYTPSVFALLPQLLERAGNFQEGSISAIYTVLVEGDDMNEPIADAVRGILDGHVVLSRKLAGKNHYPAIDILASLSRLMKSLVTNEQVQLAGKVRDLMATYVDAEDLINIGAYAAGSNPNIDQAIAFNEPIEAFLRQSVEEASSHPEALAHLAEIFGLDINQFVQGDGPIATT
ncbi:flagellar protein export ATPase FliI [Acanthopleuribacter pedis]|uniref:Flagellar protein export ATPase FliI n=1 Tax=Acanthopleuribacter pedis TaxID=442870 RepID=A0A8J7Q1L5_9BACT|nr:flagellar protein export ATPase FliI [Acanthopleuribacter pedis]MBO1317580.1 flagellar protein export ATPase FliI [Acanthopleuribacter pedis]